MRSRLTQVGAILALLTGRGGLAGPAAAQQTVLPRVLRDRDAGVAASLPGTRIRHGELLVYPFFEYVRDDNREYQPQQFGSGGDVNFRGRFRGTATQLFIGYGVSDWLALEFEAGYLTATLEKSPLDSFATPAKIDEQGIADIEGQVRARLLRESGRWPELFGFVELVAPSQTDKLLIGDPDWDAKPGIGVVKGFGWGTMTARIAAEYNSGEGHPDLGEFAIEYLKRLSPAGRIHVAFEGGEGGAMDEWELITGLQYRIGRRVSLKFDNSLGISSKANDWGPQFGLMFSFHR